MLYRSDYSHDLEATIIQQNEILVQLYKDKLNNKISNLNKVRAESRANIKQLKLSRASKGSLETSVEVSKRSASKESEQKSLFDRHISMADLWEVVQKKNPPEPKTLRKSALCSQRQSTSQVAAPHMIKFAPLGLSTLKTGHSILEGSSRVKHNRVDSMPNYIVKVKLSKEMARLHQNAKPQRYKSQIPFLVLGDRDRAKIREVSKRGMITSSTCLATSRSRKSGQVSRSSRIRISDGQTEYQPLFMRHAQSSRIALPANPYNLFR